MIRRSFPAPVTSLGLTVGDLGETCPPTLSLGERRDWCSLTVCSGEGRRSRGLGGERPLSARPNVDKGDPLPVADIVVAGVADKVSCVRLGDRRFTPTSRPTTSTESATVTATSSRCCLLTTAVGDGVVVVSGRVDGVKCLQRIGESIRDLICQKDDK